MVLVGIRRVAWVAPSGAGLRGEVVGGCEKSFETALVGEHSEGAPEGVLEGVLEGGP